MDDVVAELERMAVQCRRPGYGLLSSVCGERLSSVCGESAPGAHHLCRGAVVAEGKPGCLHEGGKLL